MLDVVSTNSVLELIEDAAHLRFEAALLSRSELGWNGEIGEVNQRFTDTLEALLELGGDTGGCDLVGGVGPDQAERRSQQFTAVRTISHAVGCDERECLAHVEAMTLDGGQDCILVFA